MTATPRRRILIVAYYYPPQNIIGARRPAALAKWLRRRGHDVTVLTSVQAGHGPDASPSRLLRARDLLATSLNWRGQNLEVVTGNSDATWEPGANFWGAIFVPDVQLISWMPFAVGAGLRLHRRVGFDAVVTTSPLESAHAVGWVLRRRGVPWIADLRDGWRFEAPRDAWPTHAQTRLDEALERLVVRGADEVVTVSAALSADLDRRYGRDIETITNGFDPDEAVPAPATSVEHGPLTLVHTGGLGAERTVRPLLEALARMAQEEPGLRDRVRLVLAGARTSAERAMYDQPAFAPFVEHRGFLSRPESMALQRRADVLVLVTSGVRTGEATGKLFEYLATGRPILVLGAGSAAAEIVTRTGSGIAIPAHDAHAAEAALRRIVTDGLPAPPAAAREPYAYPALAERYEAVVERAIASRRSG